MTSLGKPVSTTISICSPFALACASSLEKELKAAGQKKSDEAKVVGRLIAERARSAGVERVVFDRAGYRYHGRIKSLADAAREAGLEF